MDLDYLAEKYHEEIQLSEQFRDCESECAEEAELHEMRALIIDDLMTSEDEIDF